jgi:hypothetical protein
MPKLTELPNDTAPTLDDLLVTVNAPSGSAETRNAAIADVFELLGALNDGTYTTVDTGTPGVVKVQLADEIGVSSLLLLGGNTKRVSADYMTVAALPTCTYATGALGVGATLTATANGALTAQDGITPAAGDTIWVALQASVFQNGLYTVTQVGTAGTPWILTRDLNADQAADYTKSVTVEIAKGQLHAGRRLKVKGGTYTIGTAGLNAAPETSVGDTLFGVSRDRTTVVEDFDQFSTTVSTLTSTPQHIVGAYGYVYGTGTAAQVSQKDFTVSGGETTGGIANMETGTTSTGLVVIGFGGGSTLWNVVQRWEMFARLKVPTVSDGTQTFNVRAGWMDTNDGAPANGLYIEGRSGSTNWWAVARAAGSNTEVDTGIAYSTAFRGFSIIVPGDGSAYFYSGPTLIATITSGFPAAATALFAQAFILKSAGTTSRELRLDLMGVSQPSFRVNVFAP